MIAAVFGRLMLRSLPTLDKIMNRGLLSLCAVLLINPGLQVLRPTQRLSHQGKPIPITPVGPPHLGPRWCSTGSRMDDKARLVIRDRDTWLKVWKRMFILDSSHGPDPDLPPWAEIDFSREMVLVAAMGARPSSGYCIFIDSAYERDDRLEVNVRSVENRKCGGFTVMTAPVDIVRLPKTERSVVFHESEVESDCGEGLLRRIPED